MHLPIMNSIEQVRKTNKTESRMNLWNITMMR